MERRLRRSITLAPLIFYGLGTMVGGGFYALLGQVAGLAGMMAPLGLALSGVLALLSAASFAELSSRFPVSAGEVEYVWRGFHRETLATTIGWLVIATGVVSAATLAVATFGFVLDLVDVSRIPDGVGVVAVVVALGLIAGWGIGESVGVVLVITVIEVGALIVVVVLAGENLAALPDRWPELMRPTGGGAWNGVFAGAFLAFYAFIGFEDMVNIAEEVKAPRRNLPIAIMVSVVATTLLYVAVGVVAVLSVAPAELAAATTPVARVVGEGGPTTVMVFGVVSLLAGVNGALVQIVMASRVAYGMADRGRAAGWLGRVHPVTRTPLLATMAMTLVVAVLAVFFPLATLARVTSAIMLFNFTVVNLALWRVKGTAPDPGEGALRLPRWLPLVAAATCVAALASQAWTVVCR